MISHTKSISMMMVVLTLGSLTSGCDHQLRAGANHDVPRILRIADGPPRGDKLSTAPSIVRESVDPRCFGPLPAGNAEVIACPQVMQLTIAADRAPAGQDHARSIRHPAAAMAGR